ncbi:MAG TPA: DUF222 domain-containing protein [Naasia sp.]|jgi:5-methylcytosine-specific restriction protein A
MQHLTTALRDRIDTLVDRVAGMPWAEDDTALSTVLAGAHDRTLLDLVEQVGDAARLLDALAVRLCGEVARRSARDAADPLARRMGEATAAALVARTASVPVGRAASWCAVGVPVTGQVTLLGEALLPQRPAVAAALDAGTLNLEAARVILHALDTIAPRASDEAMAGVEEDLIRIAQAHPHSDLVQFCRRVPDVFDPDGAAPREEELRALAGARRIQRPNGMGRYILDADPESDGFLRAAMDAFTSPRRQVVFISADDPALDPDLEDTRTLVQRQLDAFVSMAKQSLKTDEGDTSGTAVTMLVTIDSEALQSGVGAATIAGIGTPISAATARRLACDARILPVVLGGNSQPLDLGQSRRLFSEAQRLAMAVRDGGCRWPGCCEPPSRAEGAHVRPFSLEGPTDLQNGILFCRYHRRRYDNDGWSIVRIGGERHLVPPPWIDASRTPRPMEPPRLRRRRTG